ncbi:MAG TPA: hypothetical protein VFH06_02815 [Candidatus Saccharimonadales bacterium]|nr:hypothetical protein [Candidatus Saccharimonadales bacterium]
MRLAVLRQKQFHEPVWHVVIALLAIMLLQLFLVDYLNAEIRYVLIGLEGLLLICIGTKLVRQNTQRILAIIFLALLSIVNVVSLAVVIYDLTHDAHTDGHQLLLSSVGIYLTNIIVFGIWFWELDNTRKSQTDFQFPQSTLKPNWRPTFFDYIYVSVTNATAFSPTDTLPLSHRAKLLMTIQSVVSLVIVVLVTARAVNILT